MERGQVLLISTNSLSYIKVCIIISNVVLSECGVDDLVFFVGTQTITAQHEEAKAQLESNDTYTQVGSHIIIPP